MQKTIASNTSWSFFNFRFDLKAKKTLEKDELLIKEVIRGINI